MVDRLELHEALPTPSLSYCVHTAIDTSEEIRPTTLLPTVVVHGAEEEDHRKKKKHKRRTNRSHSLSNQGSNRAPPIPPRSLRSVEAPSVTPLDLPPPPLIVQPPTPTTPTKEIPVEPSCTAPPLSCKPRIPTLNLPEVYSPAEPDPPDSPDKECSTSLIVPPCEIRIEASEDVEEEKEPKKKPDRSRKRRRSLVNILFPPKNQSSDSATTPTLEAPQGQRLHFRRVSEIFSRMSSFSRDDETPLVQDDDLETPATPPESCGLSIRNLFPYRRRRSSVTHLDNTIQFKESREEIIQNTRRRMSSFPPMDGDEAAIMLEKANVIRLEQAHQEALALQSGNSVTNAFRRLRRGSRSPSPMSLIPGMHKGKKFKWKSSTDITSCSDSQPASLPPNFAPSPLAKRVPPPLNNVVLPSFPDVQADAIPGSPLPCEHPHLPSTPMKSASVDQANEERRVFFPKRKVEDIPGIFIPKNKPSKTKTTEDADFLHKTTNLLAVMKDKPRRHSMSDPIFLQNYAAANPRPILLPRSPYSSDASCLRYS